MTPGIEVTDQDVLVAGDVALEELPTTRTELWTQLAEPRPGNDLPELLGRAASALVDEASEQSKPERHLVEQGVTAVEQDDGMGGSWYLYARLAVAATRTRLQAQRFEQVTAQLGRTTVTDVRTSLDDVVDGPLALLEAANVVPTVCLRLGSGWLEETHKTQRSRVLQFLTELADTMQVRIVATKLVQRRLARDHRDDLPASLVADLSQPSPNPPSSSASVQEAAREALVDLGRDHDAWLVLKSIADETGERRDYASLYADPRFDVGDEGMRGRVKRLRDLGLVESITDGGRTVHRLTVTGRAAVDRWLEETAVENPTEAPSQSVGGTDNTDQQATESTDDAAGVADPPKNRQGAVVSPNDTREDGDDRPAGESSTAVDGSAGRACETPSTDWLRMDRQHGLAAAAPHGGFAVRDVPTRLVEDQPDHRNRRIGIDDDREEIVIDVRASPTMAKTGARLCAALLSDKMLNNVLTPDVLDDGAAGRPLSGLLDGNHYLLRSGAGLGWLKDGMTGSQYQTALRGARQQLLHGLSHLHGTDGDFDPDVASDVLRTSQGLIGTVLRVLDLLGWRVVVHLNVPDLDSYDASLKDSLCRFVTLSSRISARYGLYGAHRVLYEDRSDVRDSGLGAPDVDPRDPVGEVVGDWVISGPGASLLREGGDGFDGLEDWLSDPRTRDLQDDRDDFAPIVVDVDIVEADRREAVANAVTRIGATRNLLETRHSVSLLHALFSDPLTAAEAMCALGVEDSPREICLDEVRYGAAQVDSRRLFPGVDGRKTGLRNVLHALLDAQRPITKSELAEMADVSAPTISSNRDTLEALGLLVVEEGGPGDPHRYRLSIPFRSERDTGDEVLQESDHLLTALWTHVSATVDGEISTAVATAERYFDECRYWDDVLEVALQSLGISVLGSSLESSFYSDRYSGAATSATVDRYPDLVPWLGTLARLSGHPEKESLGGRNAGETVAQIGTPPDPHQQSLSAAVGAD